MKNPIFTETGAAERGAEAPAFDVDAALKTEGLDEFLVRSGIDAENFDPYSNESDRETLEKRFKTFNEQKDVQKGVVEFLRGHFQKEAGVTLTGEQLKSVQEQVKEKAVSDPEGVKKYLEQLRAFQTLPGEITKKEKEIFEVYQQVGGESLTEKTKELLKKKRTLELATESGAFQSFFARRAEKMTGVQERYKAKKELYLNAFDEAVKHYKVPELITDDDKEFIARIPSREEIAEHFKKTRMADTFVERLNNNLAAADAEFVKIDKERQEKAAREKEKAEARKEAKKYGLTVPTLGVYFTGKKKTVLDELDAVNAEVGALEQKLAKATELKELSDRSKKAYETTRTGLLEGFLDTTAVAAEVKKMAEKKLTDLFKEAHGDLVSKKNSLKAKDAQKYIKQLEQAGKTKSLKGINESLKIGDYTFSSDRLREIIQEETEELVDHAFSQEIENQVASGKPDTIAVILKHWMDIGNVGEKESGTPEATAFLNGVIAKKAEEYKKGNQKVKLLNLNLAVKKAKLSSIAKNS